MSLNVKVKGQMSRSPGTKNDILRTFRRPTCGLCLVNIFPLVKSNFGNLGYKSLYTPFFCYNFNKLTYLYLFGYAVDTNFCQQKRFCGPKYIKNDCSGRHGVSLPDSI